ncbi:hypothetical protein, partial [Carnobacterium mobile]|uniref:hypothetical protein n=1 Tax=Carnobacterium mobile TaxID=2750 RepID=UPI001D01C994
SDVVALTYLAHQHYLSKSLYFLKNKNPRTDNDAGVFSSEHALSLIESFKSFVQLLLSFD